MKTNVMKKVIAFTTAAVFSVFGFVPVFADEEQPQEEQQVEQQVEKEVVEQTEQPQVEQQSVNEDEDYDEDYDEEDYDEDYDEDEDYEDGQYYEDEDGNTYYYEGGNWYMYDEETGEYYLVEDEDEEEDNDGAYNWDAFWEAFYNNFGDNYFAEGAYEFYQTFLETGFFPGQTFNDPDEDEDEDEDWDDEDWDEDEDEEWDDEEEDDGWIAAQNNKFFKNLARLEKKMAQQKYATCVENGEVETGDETNVLGAVAVMIFTVMVAYAVSRKEQ